jgi:hypothetical protein
MVLTHGLLWTFLSRLCCLSASALPWRLELWPVPVPSWRWRHQPVLYPTSFVDPSSAASAACQPLPFHGGLGGGCNGTQVHMIIYVV